MGGRGLHRLTVHLDLCRVTADQTHCIMNSTSYRNTQRASNVTCGLLHIWKRVSILSHQMTLRLLRLRRATDNAK